MDSRRSNPSVKPGQKNPIDSNTIRSSSLRDYTARAMGPKNMNTFAFEEWALDGSAVVLSLLVMLVGIAASRLGIRMSANDPYLFIGSGLAGLVLTFTVRRLYNRRVEALDGLVVKHSLAPKPPPPKPPPPPPAA